MVLTPHALHVVGLKKVRPLLAEALDVTDQSIQIYRRENKPNGPLTTYIAMQVIKDNSTLKDSDIFQEDPEPESVKPAKAASKKKAATKTRSVKNKSSRATQKG